MLDLGDVRQRVRRYRDALHAYGGELTYAGKALLTGALVQELAREGCGLDTVSGGELYLALRAGMDPARIVFHGNYKTGDEMRFALASGVGRVVVDSLAELERWSDLAVRSDKTVAALVRVAPGIGSGAHFHVHTGQEDSKFGLGWRSGEAKIAVKRALALPGIELLGLHCHIGSQITELRPFEQATQAMLGFLSELSSEFGFQASELDLGGGLGIRYVVGDSPPTIEQHVAATAGLVADWARRTNRPVPRVLLEPGRAIVGEAGVTLYTVGDRKVIPGVRTYLAVDGGMGDNPRPALYDAPYQAIAAEKAADPATQRVRVVGRYCESGDVLVNDADLPPLAPGDLLAVLATGAYNHSMASTYNRVPRPALVFVDDGQARLVERRETFADFMALETDETWTPLPYHLASGQACSSAETGSR